MHSAVGVFACLVSLSRRFHKTSPQPRWTAGSQTASTLGSQPCRRQNSETMIIHSRQVCPRDLSFCVTRYREMGGELRPERPDQCAYREERPGVQCQVAFDHLRYRSTGPCIPLEVWRCRSHGRAYTLYPPGFGPYVRTSLVSVTLDGSPQNVGAKDREPNKPRPPPELIRFEPTYFEAALDAAHEVLWPRETNDGEGNVRLRYSTQRRRIERSLAGLGIDSSALEADRFRISQTLGTPLVPDEPARLAGKARLSQARGLRVCRSLGWTTGGWDSVKRLTHAFYLAGIWGLPSFWDRKTKKLRTEPFRRPGRGTAHVT